MSNEERKLNRIIDEKNQEIARLRRENRELMERLTDTVKENEELKYENFNLKQEKMIDKSSCKPLNNFYDYYDCIPKSKIREKIEQLENKREQLGIFKKGIYVSGIYKISLIIAAYKKLLEEE